MAMTVNTNISALNAYRNLSGTSSAMNKSMEKLSSGFRINRAADDAAGLVNSEKLRSQIGGLKVATRNAQDGISVAQTAEGALNEVTTILQRVRDLTVQKANTGSNGADAVTAIDDEISQLAQEIGRIGDSTTFNGNKLFGTGTTAGGGTYTAYSGTFQVGANDSETISLSVNLDLGKIKADLFTPAVVGPPAVPAATPNLSSIDTMLGNVTKTRGTVGAVQNRFEHTIANLGVATENLTASESRIRDTDVASEMTNLSKNQILSQAGTAMLAQANQSAQNVLTLLRG
jgi:flagellin